MNRLHVAVVLVALAGCGGEPERFDAEAPDVPFMSQDHPAGAGPGYDGSEFCGPAVLAGIAKGHGWTGGLSDADLISTMADVAGTTEIGTSGNGMIAGLDWLGLEHDAVAGCDLDWIDSELAAAHDVIAVGDYWSLPNHYDANKASGHYIAVTGALADWSEYRVMDPAGGTLHRLTDEQLCTFMVNHPQNDGFAISAW